MAEVDQNPPVAQQEKHEHEEQEETVDVLENKNEPQSESVTSENVAAEEESNEAPQAEETPAEEETAQEEEAAEEEAEEKPKVTIEDVKTAPADYRFPTTNQTRHCFTRYIEYHKCIAAKGEDASECEKFAKYYRSLCPSEWIEKWNEQRENGVFPGPL